METELVTLNGWVLRKRSPVGEAPFPVFLLLHGWTGDENAMWVFASRLPANALLLAPRGLHATPLGGWSWHDHRSRMWSSVDDFRPAVQSLVELLSPENIPEADVGKLRIVGFSQGAALAYTLALLHPQRVAGMAGLSGFMPDEADVLTLGAPLAGLPVFCAHGSQDELVPVEKARRAVEQLQRAGAKVTYCEDEVGHRLSVNCFRGLETFFRRTL